METSFITITLRSTLIVVVPVSFPSMGQIEVFNLLLCIIIC